MMKILKSITTTLVYISIFNLYGAETVYEQKKYPYPVEGVTVAYSGSFGETRTNHFHSGVDIRTDGVEGKAIVSIDDGYVSRISLSPGGFGLALYIAHSNGTTSVYAHLQKLTKELDDYLMSERYRLKQHSLNIYPVKDQFRVSRGEIVAYSGNSGSSSGPHLHFEVRNSRLQKPLNPVKMGVVKPVDKIAPALHTLYYVEVDDSGVVDRQQIQTHPLRRDVNGVYRISKVAKMWVGRKGYFVITSSDRESNSSSIFGLYSLEGRIDGERFYKYCQDGFTFDMTRYSNGVSFYPYQLDSRYENIQMRRQKGVPASLFADLESDGIVGCRAGENREVEIIATDHIGNRSVLKFTMCGKGDADLYHTTLAPPKEVIYYDRPSKFSYKDLNVSFVEGAVYSNTEFTASQYSKKITLPSGVERLSPAYLILKPTIPLHRSMSVSIKKSLTDQQRDQLLMCYIDRRGGVSPLSATYKNGVVTASSSTAGSFFVAVDSESPTITTTLKDGSNLKDMDAVRFVVRDNFSGVARYSATLNGEWIALDLRGSTLTHVFRNQPDGREYTLEVEIADLVGNKAILTRKFRR